MIYVLVMNKLKFYIFLGLVLISLSVLNGQNHTVFKHLSPTLDNRSIHISSTSQDHLGNIWMEGGGGVLIYNGYDYNFVRSSSIFKSLKKNDGLEKIIADSNKNIWLISKFGLVTKYNAKNSKFEDITPLLKKDDGIIDIIIKKESVWLASKNGTLYQFKNSKIHDTISSQNINISSNTIYDFEIGTDEFYLSTNTGKVFSYNINSKQATEIVGPFTDYPESLTLLIDPNNRLWIGTETFGLFVYDLKSRQFIQDSFFKEQKFNINKEMFLNLFYSSNGHIYGGTDGGGLYKINVNTGTIDLYTRQASNESSINSNTIMNISEDNHKNLWISTKNGNLNIIPNANNNIGYHQGSENNAPLRILCIYKSSNGALWAGTDGSGLTKITYNSDGTTNETQYFNNTNLNKGFYVQSITEDNKANIWFGTYRNGLWHYNTQKNTFKKINVVNSKKQEATDVRTVFKDSKGRIWVGSNVSLNVYNSDLMLLASFNNSSNGLKGFILESMTEDVNGTLWLGIYHGGLFEFDENQDNLSASSFINYSYTTTTKRNENEIYAARNLCPVSLNELWLTNNDWEVLKFNTKTKTYRNLNYLEVINGKTFATIIKEDDDNYWLSSSNGINHLNIKDKTLKTYYTSDGLQDNMFLSRSAFKDKEGIIYFGGIKGLNYFDPKKLEKKASNAKLFINTIKVLNQPADSLIAPQITSGIHNVKTLNLSYNQSSFSFRYSAIDNLLSPKYYYAYRLKGFDKDWITSPERIASYTNIPSGNYTFEVKAGTKKNVWDIPVKRIEIKIEQPIWNKPIAYLVYFLIIGGIIYGIRRWYGLRKKLFLEKVSHKKENEIHKAKMNFFAKMSHEIQTPITLILGPIDDMLKRSEQNGNLLLKQRLSIISQNAKRLSKIARELTLVRNKELDKLRLIVTKNNLHEDIETIALSFKELARKKQVDFAVNCPKNLSEAWYDKEKLEHIVYNLLSNAFKFTPKEGNVQLNVIPIHSKRSIKLSVTDSGPGIPKNELETIFELFYQSNIGKKNKGSGIGLALTKDLVDLHKGEIEVSSKPSEGTTFTITLPIKEDGYDENERITTSENHDSETILTTNSIEAVEQDDLDISKKTILIVEDNYDLQNFLKELLIDKYNILLAENGEEGYLYAKNNYPDLILSDIMMPKVDGIEMCRKLQINQLTKHIPIILLTAKNSTNSKIHGLKSGAIEYINKPFNTKELLLKVKNIMVSKERIISKYRKEVISHPEVTQQKTHDEIFLENMMSYINLRLDDPNFKMEELADALNLSYSSLYRKCMALTGQSIVDFVRRLRLKKAAILITKYGYTISETAYMVGFNDPKYFSKSFKSQFNKTPKDFKNKALSSKDIESYLKQYKIDSAAFSN